MNVAQHVQALPRSGIRAFFDLVLEREDVVSLGVGEPDFATPWHIRESAMYALERGKTTYTANLGLLSLRKEIARYVYAKTGHAFAPETETIVTSGVSEALDIALRAILNPGDEVIYHSPSFVSYRPNIALAFGVPVAVSTTEENGFNLLAKDVEEKITEKTTALIVSYPNNPTGAKGHADEFEKIAQCAVRNNLFVIIDEIYNEIVYAPFESIARALPKENVIYLNGLSKSYSMTGFRVGYACAPKDILEGMLKIHQYVLMCASTISQEAAIEAFRHGDEEKERMRAEYEKRRNFIVSGLNEIGLRCSMPQGAFYAFPSVASLGVTGTEFANRLLAEENVAAVPGEAFGPEGVDHIRCSYAVSIEEIEFALNAMRALAGRLS